MHRVENCFGIPLWKSAKRYVELWFCFSAVQRHSHPDQHSEIVPLFGWSRFYRVPPDGEEQCVRISPRKWFHAFSVGAGWVHWFSGTPLIFLNISSGNQSAGVNFKPA